MLWGSPEREFTPIAPSGLIHAGEELWRGAVREVEEETGVQTVFRSVLAIRHAHGVAFGKSDLFAVVALTPVRRRVEAVVGDERGGEGGSIAAESDSDCTPTYL